MVTQEHIQATADRIAAQFQPDKVILFGSYAYGEPTEDSDVDFLVVMPADKRDRKAAARIRAAVHGDCSMDLLVYDSHFLQQRYEMQDWFVREMLERGRVLYETGHAGVG